MCVSKVFKIICEGVFFTPTLSFSATNGVLGCCLLFPIMFGPTKGTYDTL
jgi:hypothetical protein